MKIETVVHILTADRITGRRLALCEPSNHHGEPYDWPDHHHYIEHRSDIEEATCEVCLRIYNLDEETWKRRMR